jgi:VWFA-related protein
VILAAGLIFLPSTLFAQQTPPTQGAAASEQSAPAPEIATQESQPEFTLKARAYEVLVRVVVRDAQGRAVTNLTRDDFRLLDNGKPQVIREFSPELVHPTVASAVEKSNRPPAGKQPEKVESPAGPPERFVALYFDDIFMGFEDVVRTRQAATHYLETAITPGDRVGLFTSSGQQSDVPFTRDLSAVEKGLAKLRPNPRTRPCKVKEEFYAAYNAYWFLETGMGGVQPSSGVHQTSASEGSQANAGGPIVNPRVDTALQLAPEARMAWAKHRTTAVESLARLEALVRRLSMMPGQRSIVWISPGFLAMDQDDRLTSLIERALRAHVVISALDSRGLWMQETGIDFCTPGYVLPPNAQAADLAAGDVLAVVASGTGGILFHDSNDFDAGFRQVGGLPEAAYLLSFSPADLEYDGKFHKLAVQLVHGRGLSVQARKGYYAPSAPPATERAATGETWEPAPPALAVPPVAPPAAPEIATQESQPQFTLKARTNEVLVRVVVRDAQGKGVANLTKDDFRLLDNGKAQAIREFSIETGQPTTVAPAAPREEAEVERAPQEAKPTTAPAARFVALYFDDTFMSFEDVVRTRNATTRYLKTSITPGDRVGLYTSSGVGNVGFTSGLSALDEALAKLRPQPSSSFQQANDSVNLSDYESYLISEVQEPQALEVGVAKVVEALCGGNARYCPVNPTEYAKRKARSVWERTQFGAQQSLRELLALVRRMGAMPGQRSIVWISPGFLAMDQPFEMSSLVDQALRAHVVINALDSRGLWAMVPGGDASQGGPGLPGRLGAEEAQYAHAAQLIESDVMIAATSGTGGVFFHDSNDYDAGFRMVGGLPEVAYLLSFSPENLKYDGKYHKLSVQLVNGRGLSVQARKGYFAPSAEVGSERAIKEDLVEAVFSPEERKDLPLEVETQFFMSTPTDGQLSVEARLDLHGVRLHKEQERNVDELRFVTALFDDNGNLLEGQQRIVTLHLRDTTLSRLLATGGLKLGWHFQVKPGTYVVKEVARDSGSGDIAALSRTVEIPYPN